MQGITPASDPIILLRSTLRQEYPEIDEIYHDNYLANVLSQSSSEGIICSSCSSSLDGGNNDNNYIGIATKKIRESLQWRRDVNVDLLTSSAYVVCDDYVNEGVFRPTASSTAAAAAAGDDVIPPTTTELVNICQSGAFRFVGFDNKGKAILHARASLLNWRKINVDDGIKYHILVIENALKAMVMRNDNVKKKEANNGVTPPPSSANNDIGVSSESMILYIDTSNMGLLPPPLAALTGLAMLMQTAYPYRFERAYVGPVNILLRGLNKAVSVFLTAGSRQKITMMKNVPSNETVGELLEEGNVQSTLTS